LPFLTPEHLGAGDKRPDVRSDVYSLAVILYVLLTEQFPYQVQGEFPDVCDAILRHPPMPLREALRAGDPERRVTARDMTLDLEAIVQRALSKEKAGRYQTAAALADDIRRLRRGHAVEARAAHRLYRLRKAARLYWLPLSVAMLFVAT